MASKFTDVGQPSVGRGQFTDVGKLSVGTGRGGVLSDGPDCKVWHESRQGAPAHSKNVHQSTPQGSGIHITLHHAHAGPKLAPASLGRPYNLHQSTTFLHSPPRATPKVYKSPPLLQSIREFEN